MKYHCIRFQHVLRDMPVAVRFLLFVFVAAVLFCSFQVAGPMLAVAAIAAPEIIDLDGPIIDSALTPPIAKQLDNDAYDKAVDLSRNFTHKSNIAARADIGMKWLSAFMNGNYSEAGKIAQKSWEKSTLAPNVEGTNADGGFLVPAEFASDLAYYISQVSIAMSTFPNVRMNRKVWNLSTLSSRPSVAWYSENATLAAVKLAFGRLVLTTSKIGVICAFSNELWEDANVDVYQHSIRIIGGVIAKELDTQCFRGTGTPWTGIFGTSSINIVYQGGSSTSGKTKLIDITWDDLANMVMGIDPEYADGGVIFLQRQAVNVLFNQKDSQNQYVYQQTTWVNDKIAMDNNFLRFNFRGIPVIAVADQVLLSIAWDTSAHASTKQGLFFNPSKAGTWLGIRTDLRALIEQSGTVDGVDAFANDLQLVRLTQRLAFGVAQPSYIVALSTSAS